jgi:hypothetical protein
MTSENLAQKDHEKSFMPSRGVSGPVVVLTLGVLVIGFPLACVLISTYARSIAAAPNPNYTALRDPLAWLFIGALFVACIGVARFLGRIGRK